MRRKTVNHETIAEMQYRLRQQAKNSKDNSKQFRYIGNGLSKIVINNENILSSRHK